MLHTYSNTELFTSSVIMHWLIPILPLLGYILISGFRNYLTKNITSLIGSSSILIAFVFSILCYNTVKNGDVLEINLFPFIRFGSKSFYFGLLLDKLTSIYLLVITGIGFLIHIYSIGYMHEESKSEYARYFAYLNLFVFSMLVLVSGSSYIITFIGWEGVGLCSYLLIGYWFKNIQYSKAAQKAFVINRIGDLGFLAGMFMIFSKTGSLHYIEVSQFVKTHDVSAWINFATFCLFLGATGKSAQLPLFTWLPDAMAGPTPVSALIHAATMVTAGIYMISRSQLLFDLAPQVQQIIAWIGVATALVSATIATKQNDIKKVLAYSTVSQLGFMFVALGVGAYTAAIFHVVTHAFFKALLFLGSGSVIHAMGGEQDMRFMGGLIKKMKITGITFWIGCLAISGIPILSGFFSKDEILLNAFATNKILWALLAFAALLTAYYMFRALFLTFHGTFRGTHTQEKHLHESPISMTLPLIILSALSVIGGFINIPHVLGGHNWLAEFLSPVIESKQHTDISNNTEWMLMGLAIFISLIGIFWAKTSTSKPEFKTNSGIQKFFEDKWRIDEFYFSVITAPLKKIGVFFKDIVDPSGIDALVNGMGTLTLKIADRLRHLQSGKVGYYMFGLVIGLICIILLTFFIKFIP